MDRFIHRVGFGCAAVLSALVVFGVLFTVSATAADETVSQLKLLNLLRAGDFDALEQILAEVENKYDAGHTSDEIIDHAFAAFASADPDLDTHFTQWITANPDSHRPYLARGYYHLSLGWMFRGGGFVNRTARQKFDLMDEHFARAIEDMNTVLKRKSNSGPAYALLISMAMAQGQRDTKEALLKTGLTADPRSFSIRQRYLVSVTPWWGGNGVSKKSIQQRLLGRLSGREYPVQVPDALQRFVAEIEIAATETPTLKPLEGYVEFIVAEILGREGRAQEATDFYKRAIELGDWWYFRFREGKNFYDMGQYGDAIGSFSRSLELRPDNQNVLRERANAYRALENIELALTDLDQALLLDPKDPEILFHKANVLREAGRADDALATFDEALIYGKYDAYIYAAKGNLYFYELGDPALAVSDLKRATELDPTEPRYWYNYAGALYTMRDCEAVNALEEYLALCPSNASRCFSEGTKFARQAIEALNSSGICPA